MKKAAILPGLVLFLTFRLIGQSTGKQHLVGAGLQLPVGVFAESHVAGIGASYAWSHRRWGQMQTLPKKIIGFAATGGFDYYLGKKIEVAGYDFRYGNYLYMHAFGGMVYNPGKKTNLLLAAGPTAGLYKGNINAGYGVRLDGSYYINEKIALSPGLLYMKHALVNTLWAISVKGVYCF